MPIFYFFKFEKQLNELKLFYTKNIRKYFINIYFSIPFFLKTTIRKEEKKHSQTTRRVE